MITVFWLSNKRSFSLSAFPSLKELWQKIGKAKVNVQHTTFFITKPYAKGHPRIILKTKEVLFYMKPSYSLKIALSVYSFQMSLHANTLHRMLQ